MGTLREHLRTTLLGTALLIQPAPSFTLTDDPVRIFATCAGRMSAVMEHQWLTDGPGSEETKLLRDAHLALLEATASPEMTGLALNWRIDAKVAQANLLNLASFGPHPTARRLAHLQAERLTEACTALLLGQS
jgi:hypothetical protein